MRRCDLRMRWTVACDLRFRAAIYEPKTPSVCGVHGDLALASDCDSAILVRRALALPHVMLLDKPGVEGL